jgi:hypothetical protein
MLYSADNSVRHGNSLDRLGLNKAIMDQGFFWVDFTGPTREDLELVGQVWCCNCLLVPPFHVNLC